MNKSFHSNYMKAFASLQNPQPIKPKQNEKELVLPTDDFCHCIYSDKWMQERWFI